MSEPVVSGDDFAAGPLLLPLWLGATRRLLVFHTKATPLWDGTIFGQVFGRGGMIKFSK